MKKSLLIIFLGVLMTQSCDSDRLIISKSDLHLIEKITEFNRVESYSSDLGITNNLEYHNKDFAISFEKIKNDKIERYIDSTNIEIDYYKYNGSNGIEKLIFNFNLKSDSILLPFILKLDEKYDLKNVYEGEYKDEYLKFSSLKPFNRQGSITLGYFDFVQAVRNDSIIGYDSVFSIEKVDYDICPKIIDKSVLYDKPGWLMISYKTNLP